MDCVARTWEPGKSYGQVTDELVANACQTMLLNDRAVKEMARENMSLAEKVADVLDDVREKIKAAFDGIQEENRAVFAAVRAVTDEIDNIAELWGRGIAEATENYNAERTVREAEGKEKTAPEGGESQRQVWDQKRYENRINVWAEKGKKPGWRFMVGESPAALVDIGIPSRKVYLFSNSILHAQKLHPEISDGVVKQIPQLVRSPILVMQSKTQINRVTMMGEVYGDNGLPVVAILNLVPSEDGLSVDDITLVNAYTKAKEGSEPTIAGTQNLINESDILFIEPDKKRTDTWLDTNRLQLPLVPGYGPIKKVTLLRRDVNGNFSAGTQEAGDNPMMAALKRAQAEKAEKATKSQNQVWDEGELYNSRALVSEETLDSAGNALTRQQAEFFADSKIRDAEGRLKVMYRGGDGDFTVFDRRKSSYSNLYGRGFYFTDSREHAGQYGRARAFYLNIATPLQAGDKTFKRAQVRAFLEAVAEDEDYGLENYGYGATVESVLRSLWGKDDFSIIADVNATCVGDMVAAAELFNAVNGTQFDGIVVPTETVAFRSNQIKETDNKAPTEHEDIRYQRFDDTTDDTAAEQEGREAAYARIQSENAILKETVDALKSLNEKQVKTIAALTNKHGLGRIEIAAQKRLDTQKYVGRYAERVDNRNVRRIRAFVNDLAPHYSLYQVKRSSRLNA